MTADGIISLTQIKRTNRHTTNIIRQRNPSIWIFISLYHRIKKLQALNSQGLQSKIRTIIRFIELHNTDDIQNTTNNTQDDKRPL